MRTRPIAALFAATLLAGCAQALPPSIAGPAATTAAVRRAPHDGHAVFRIKVPRKRARAARVGRHYISPATQSMTLSIGGPTVVNRTVALTPGSTNCISTISATLCSFSVTLAPGAYTATIVAYDAPGGVGNQLSAAQAVGFTISPGVDNAVKLTLSGIPARLAVTATSSASVQNAAGRYDLLGAGAHAFVVEAFDADDNAIVGPGAPTFAVAQSAGSLALTLATPAPKTPNAFSISPPAAFSSSTGTVTVTAQYAAPESDVCSTPGPGCSATFTFDMQTLIAAGGSGGATIYEGGTTKPFASITDSVDYPSSIAFDRSGDLWVASCLSGCFNGTSIDTVLEYQPPYTAPPLAITNGIAGPSAIAFDSTGKLFVANCGSCALGQSDDVTVYAPPFSASSSPVATISSGVHDPTALAFDGSADLFVASCFSCSTGGTDTVLEFASPYSGAPTVIGSGSLSGPYGLALDSSANLFVASEFSNKVQEFAPPYSALAASISNGMNQPLAIVADGSGNIFVAERGSNKIQQYEPPYTNGSTPSVTISNGVSTPVQLAIDPSANVYVANTGSGVTGYFPSPYTSGITALQNLAGGSSLVTVLP